MENWNDGKLFIKMPMCDHIVIVIISSVYELDSTFSFNTHLLFFITWQFHWPDVLHLHLDYQQFDCDGS